MNASGIHLKRRAITAVFGTRLQIMIAGGTH